VIAASFGASPIPQAIVYSLHDGNECLAFLALYADVFLDPALDKGYVFLNSRRRNCDSKKAAANGGSAGRQYAFNYSSEHRFPKKMICYQTIEWQQFWMFHFFDQP
jgi:hypothetical protein